eukprot:325332-Chlamydomonas_euryale.AAC.1
MADFLSIQDVTRTFTRDAFVMHPHEKRCKVFHTHASGQRFLDVHALTNEHVWIAAPVNSLKFLLTHYARVRDAATTACVMLPSDAMQHHAWLKILLQSWQKIKTFPAGYPLLVRATGMPRLALPFSVDIMYDPPK